MTSTPVNLFSYGTLQQEKVQIETFGRLLQGAPDALSGYRREMVRITDPAVIASSGSDQHPIVMPTDDPADEITGTVFEITAAELDAADAYEVADYKRVQVRLKSGRDAWIYVKA